MAFILKNNINVNTLSYIDLPTLGIGLILYMLIIRPLIDGFIIEKVNDWIK